MVPFVFEKLNKDITHLVQTKASQNKSINQALVSNPSADNPASFRFYPTSSTVVALPNNRLTAEQIKWLHHKVDLLEQEGKISRIHPEKDLGWNSPLQLVPKGNGWRFTCNFRPTVNKHIESDGYPLPLIQTTLQHMSQYRWFGKIDLTNGFWNLRTEDELTRQMMAFSIPEKGRYHWNVLAQGLKVSPSIFQRNTDELLKEMKDTKAYIDDFIIGGKSEQECRDNINRAMSVLKAHSFGINMDKSILEPQQEIQALGFRLSHNSITPTSFYIEAIRSFPTPNDAKSLRKYLGKLSPICKLYPNILPFRSELYGVLTRAKNRWTWTPQANKAFLEINHALLSPMALQHFDPDETKEVQIAVDAGEQGYAANLYQDEKLVGTLSRKYHVTTLGKLSAGAKEAFALKEALISFRDRIQNRPIKVFTDNQALSKLVLKTHSTTSAFLTRILSEISEFQDRLIVQWIPRSDPRIQLVDILGRDPT